MHLASTSDLVQVITTGTANVDVHASWADVTAGVVTAGRTNTKISTAATTTVVGSPAASTVRKLNVLLLNNNHASASNTVTIQHTDGTNVIIEWVVTLLAGERVRYVDEDGFRVYDSVGREKLSSAALPSGSSSTAAQGPGFATDTYIAGSNWNVGTGRLQAGTFFRWQIHMSKTAAGSATPIFNIRWGTAGTTADTARVIFTGSAGTAAADTADLVIIGALRTHSATGVLQGDLKLYHVLAATGFVTTNSVAGNYYLSTTSSAFDTTVVNSVVGLSMNGGTSAAWTVTTCTLDVVNLLV